MSTVVVKDLRVDLDDATDVVADIDLTIDAGEVVGLVGESGSGKTTVGVALLGEARTGARITGGSVTVDDREVVDLGVDELVRMRGSVVSYVPQDPSAALNPALRIGKQLDELFEFHESATSTAERAERVAATLREVNLPTDAAFLARYPHQLSGGQQQRVTLAMAFLLRPKAIVLDEPTTGLDVTTQRHVLRTVRDLCTSKRVAALYVTHDMAVVASLAHRILVMYAGRIVESGSRQEIFEQPAHPYTRALIAAVPLVSARRQLVAIPGKTPAPGDRPTGCAFHPRCQDATAECSTVTPLPVETAPGHTARCLRAGELTHPTSNASSGASSRPSLDDGDAALLQVEHLDARHGRRQVLHDVSLRLAPRECLALVGESGCGKTTLARAIIGLHTWYEGDVSFAGRPLERHARDRPPDIRRALQYVFQSPYNSLNPRRSVGEILLEPLTVLFSTRGKDAREQVADVLRRVSLSPDLAQRYPGQLSGGERQRVAIARALVCRPQVLICDEITSALDVSVQASIVRLLRRLQEEEGLALLFVTHNLALVRTIADNVIAMRAGRLVDGGPVDDVLDRPQDPFTKELIDATPRFESETRG